MEYLCTIRPTSNNNALLVSYFSIFLLRHLVCIYLQVMPVVAPIMKVQACRKLKANVIIKGKDMGEAKIVALDIAEKQKLAFING